MKSIHRLKLSKVKANLFGEVQRRTSQYFSARVLGAARRRTILFFCP